MTEIERIIKLIDWLIFSKKVKNRRDMAEIMGYTESSLSQILNNKVPISDKFIKKLSIVDSDINTNWVLTGEGEMLKQSIGSNINISNNKVGGGIIGGNGINVSNNNDSDAIIQSLEQKNKILEIEKDAALKEIELLKKMLEDKEKIISLLSD